MNFKPVRNVCLSLRQGDLPSTNLFRYGIETLLSYLNNRLQGLLISYLPVQDLLPLKSPPLPPPEERYKIIGYADNVKPAVTTMEEFKLVDKAMAAEILRIRSVSSSLLLGGGELLSKLTFPVPT